MTNVIYFGCAPKGQGLLTTQGPSSDQFANIYKTAPFAFDYVADTISYNSCTNFVNGVNSETGIPGFMIGANEGAADTTGSGASKGGLKLRSDFLSYVGKNFVAEYPSATISADQIKRVISNSPANQNAYLQFAIRDKNDLTIVLDLINPVQASDKIAQVDRDAKVVLADLSSGYVANILTNEIVFNSNNTVLKEGSRKTVLSQSGFNTLTQATLGFNATADSTSPALSVDPNNTNKEISFGKAEYFAEVIRNGFNSNTNKLILTSVYGGKISDVISGANTTEATITTLKRPSATGNTTVDLSRAYGRGYSLTFTSKATNVAGWAKNILSSVSETDLSTGSAVNGVTWTCENVVIARSDHWNNKMANQPNCTPLLAADITATRKALLRKIRRQYSESEWNVGLFIPSSATQSSVASDRRTKDRPKYAMCISPIGKSCYLPTTGIVTTDPSYDVGINYDPTKECYLTSYVSHGFNYSSATTDDNRRKLGRCAQYASICTRNSSSF